MKNFLSSLNLTLQLTKRDVQSRYQGSVLGLLWSVFTPLLMLGVYTFVFSVVFKAKWNLPVENKMTFALVLFCGLTAYNIFAETISRAPGIIVGNPNYIKRVIFPLEILPVTVLCAALFNGVVSMVILIVANFLFTGHLYWTVLYLPVVILPLLLATLGVGWFLASLGVFVRDVNQLMPVVVTVLLFMSPIFYPVSAIPDSLKHLFHLNPISYVVEDTRQVLLWGNSPNWLWLSIGTILGLMTSILGYIWFQKTRKGFADVV